SDPIIVRTVELFRRIDRLLPSVRQYGWQHPETDSKLHNAFQYLVEGIRDGGAIVWRLTPYAFVHGGRTVWEPAHPFDAIPYHLYAAGVRRVRLNQGIAEDELRQLVEVFLMDPVRDLAPEDDLAAALWERRLEHVACDVINVFAEGDADDREQFYDEADRLAEVARRAAEQRVNVAEAAAMNVETDEEALRAAREAANVLALDPIAKRALGAQLAMSPERWSERFVDVFVDA